MSYFSNEITGGLFPEWTPVKAVERVLSLCNLPDDELSNLLSGYEEFRDPDVLPVFIWKDDVKTSKEWFRLLFAQSDGQVRRDFDFVTYGGGPSPGFIGQINLDNIGRDYLCYIYFRQKVSETMRNEGLEETLRSVLKQQEGEPVEFNNLNNSLIPVEALWDYLCLCQEYDLSQKENENSEDTSTNVDHSFDLPFDKDGKDLSIILSDPPQRRTNIFDIPSFVGMMRNTSNLSRLIRDISVCLQNGGDWEEIQKKEIKHLLRQRISLFRDRRVSIGDTELFARGIAMSREFCLWDTNRGDRLPSIRTICEKRKIPYPELLRILKTLPDNRDEGGLQRFSGLEFLRKGFSNRLIYRFAQDIISRRKK